MPVRNPRFPKAKLTPAEEAAIEKRERLHLHADVLELGIAEALKRQHDGHDFYSQLPDVCAEVLAEAVALRKQARR